MNPLNPSTADRVRLSTQQRRDRRRFSFRLRSLRRQLGVETGSSLIEFAISVPVLFIMMIGFCQICIAIYSNFCIDEMARDTARWASVRGSNSCADAPAMTDCGATASEIEAEAKKIAYPGVNPSNLSVSTAWLQASSTGSVTWSECTNGTAICNAPGNAVQVTVNYPFPIQIPFTSSHTWSFSSTSQIVIVQ